MVKSDDESALDHDSSVQRTLFGKRVNEGFRRMPFEFFRNLCVFMPTTRLEPHPRERKQSLFSARAAFARISAPLLLTTVILVGILTLPATPYGGDPVAWQAEATSILIRGELNIPPPLATTYGDRGQFFVLNHNNGKYYSKYGTLNGVLNVVPLLAGYFINNGVLALGLFAVVLSAFIAYLVYDLAGYYTSKEWVRAAFVLLCFYTTYAWNYLRCTNSEPTQWLFFLLMVRSLFQFNRGREREKHPFRAVAMLWVWTGCLCVTKVSWVLMIPLVAGAITYLGHREEIRRSPWLQIVLPATLICGVVALNNWVKFGAPWLSGYHQWREPDAKVDLAADFYDMILSSQWSLLICFPPVVLAIAGWKQFWREHKEEAIFIIGVFVVFLHLNVFRGTWRGQWGYGPRYFLFILPMLALPGLYVLEWAGEHIRRPSGYLTVGAVLIASLLLASVQWQVNRLEWFFKYHVEQRLISLKNPQVHSYFEHTHFAKINWDYWRSRHDLTKIPYYNQIRSGLSKEQLKKFVSGTQTELAHPNLYWWQSFSK